MSRHSTWRAVVADCVTALARRGACLGPRSVPWGKRPRTEPPDLVRWWRVSVSERVSSTIVPRWNRLFTFRSALSRGRFSASPGVCGPLLAIRHFRRPADGFACSSPVFALKNAFRPLFLCLQRTSANSSAGAGIQQFAFFSGGPIGEGSNHDRGRADSNQVCREPDTSRSAIATMEVAQGPTRVRGRATLRAGAGARAPCHRADGRGRG